MRLIWGLSVTTTALERQTPKLTSMSIEFVKFVIELQISMRWADLENSCFVTLRLRLFGYLMKALEGGSDFWRGDEEIHPLFRTQQVTNAIP